VKPILWLCFTLSGAAALALELLWMRSAALVLGATAPTAAAVLASYFAGLGLGGFFARQAPSQPIRRYGALELAAAAGAVWSYVAFSTASSAWLQRVLEAGGQPARAALVALAVVPATVVLGATLPTLGHALATPATVGSRGGLLYSLNTLGGVGGIAAIGFGLPVLIGVRASYAATAATSALVGALAFWIGDDPAPASSTPAQPAAAPARLRIVAAGAGFLAIGLEVLWIRLFAQVLHNSVNSFAAVSLVFVSAIAIGAALAARMLRRAPPERLAAASLLVAGLTSVAGIWSFVHWTGGLGYFGMQSGLPEYVLRIVGLAAATAGPTAFASGAVLPALWAAFGDRESVSRPIGDLTAANLAGSVLGAVVAGFFALPVFGLRVAFLLIAVGTWSWRTSSAA
jgi:spermidine synthase